MSGGSSAFACRMCGQCCEGRGGIVVSPTDEARLCRALRLDPPTFRERYTEQRNGKMHLRVGRTGAVFFFVKQADAPSMSINRQYAVPGPFSRET